MVEQPKDIEKFKSNYSDSKLWEKLRAVAKKAGIKVVYNALLLYYTLKDEKTPAKHKVLIMGALGYFILPIDLIPDVFVPMGYADDLAAIVAVVATVKCDITPEIKSNAKAKCSEWFGEFDENEI